MSQLGTYLLLLALVVAGYGLVAAAVGAKTGRLALVESARRSAFGLLAIVAAAAVTMVVALLTNDFAIRYVAAGAAYYLPLLILAAGLVAAITLLRRWLRGSASDPPAAGRPNATPPWNGCC